MPTTRRSRRSIVLAALSLFASATLSVAQTYKVTDLGTLSGNLVSKAYALNNAGDATGTSSNPTAAIAVRFSGGKTTSISTLGRDCWLELLLFQSKFRSPGISVQQRRHEEHQLAVPVSFRHRGLGH
jgi:hypothetical protein